MPARNHIDAEAGIVLSYVAAHATPGQVIANIKMLGSNDALAGFNDLTVFEDLDRVVGKLAGDNNSLRTVADLLSSAYGTGGDFKSAYIVNKQVDYGLMRMYTTYRGREDDRQAVFFDVREGLAWIGLPEEQTDHWLEVIQTLKHEAHQARA